MKKYALSLITIVLTIAFFEGFLQLIFDFSISENYSATLAPTEIGKVPENHNEMEIYEVNRHLTDLNRQPKTPHPYFGFTFNNTLKNNHKINRHGFADPRQFPYKKSENEFVVGIFGGSVAEGFSVSERRLTRKNMPSLASGLQKIFSEKLGTKKITILNFAMSSYRQPQQFLVSAFYLESLDMAINIDGYNEVSTDTGGEYPLYFPAYSKFFYSKNPNRQKYWLDILDLRNRQINLTKSFLESTILRSSYLSYYFWKARHVFLEKKIRRLQDNRPEETARIYNSDELSVEALDGERVGTWSKFLKLQHKILTSSNIPVFFFVQPNQYVKGTKKFSSEELEHFYKPTDTTERISKSYQKLIAKAQSLKAQNLPVYDLTSIFSDIDETIYVDSCCHYNDLGNTILKDEILKTISQNKENFILNTQDRKFR